MKAEAQEVLQIARHHFAKNPDWVSFYRDTLGVNGAARRKFPLAEAWLEFEKTDQHAEIQLMVAQLRGRSSGAADEPTRVITVRLPESMHKALRVEAEERHTSMNKLCISKLLQIVGGDLIPTVGLAKANGAVEDEEAAEAVGRSGDRATEKNQRGL